LTFAVFAYFSGLAIRIDLTFSGRSTTPADHCGHKQKTRQHSHR
jgi:hypothetical protein